MILLWLSPLLKCSPLTSAGLTLLTFKSAQIYFVNEIYHDYCRQLVLCPDLLIFILLFPYALSPAFLLKPASGTLWRIVPMLLKLLNLLHRSRSSREFMFHLFHQRWPLANDCLIWKYNSTVLFSLAKIETDTHFRATLQYEAEANHLLETEPLFVFFLIIILLTPIYYHFLLKTLLINYLYTSLDLWISFLRIWLNRTTQFNPIKCLPPTHTSLISLIFFFYSIVLTF